MIERRLSSAQAAERLGVKPATLYSYVSRGLLHPQRGPRGSTYDLQEVARLARSARSPRNSGRPPGRREAATGQAAVNDPVFVTELTLIRSGRLYYRGHDVVDLSRRYRFEEVAEWLWTGAWPEEERPSWEVPPAWRRPLQEALAAVPAGAGILDRLAVAVVTVALIDDLRHDLAPAGVTVTARSLLAALTAALPLGSPATPAAGGVNGGGAEGISERVWAGLTGRPVDEPGARAVEAALVLGADHELAPTTLAARVAASFRADPYAVVLTALGPARGSSWAGSTGAPTEVEVLLGDCQRLGAERAVGEWLRRTGDIPPGFGMPLYPDGDPRATEMLLRLEKLGDPGRRAVVEAVLEVGRERGFPPPNFDLGLGALSFCAGMVPGAGQALMTVAKAAGWLAHAMEEYAGPTRFRSRADYVGPDPAGPVGVPETAGARGSSDG